MNRLIRHDNMIDCYECRIHWEILSPGGLRLWRSDTYDLDQLAENPGYNAACIDQLFCRCRDFEVEFPLLQYAYYYGQPAK